MNSLHKLVDDGVDFLSEIGIVKSFLQAELIRLADGIKCFDIGDADEITDIKFQPSDFNFLRLPYLKCWFECHAFSAGKLLRFGVIAERGQNENVFHSYITQPGGVWVYIGRLRFDSADNFSFNTHAKIIAGAEDVSFRCVTVVAKFLKMLSCVNVELIEQVPDRALQKARERKGKLAMFSTWVCVLKGKSARGEWMGGTHGAPRLHYRRGHVRTLPVGDVWVRECMVGSKELGLVEKTYAREKGAPPSAQAGR